VTPEQIDQHLDAVLRASGSALRNYSLEKPKAEMRAAVRAIIAQARAEWEAELVPVAWRYQTPTGWHATTDAGKALVMRDYHPVEALTAIPSTKEGS
jgi:hypothetical protein